MLVFEFIHRIIDILTDYLGEVSESSIRENFVTVYQVARYHLLERFFADSNLIRLSAVAIRRNDGLRVPAHNGAQHAQGYHHATYNHEQSHDNRWSCCRVRYSDLR